MNRQFGHAIKRRIDSLDPVRDHEEVMRLTFEVLYGDPVFIHAGYLVGFARQMAVPAIARVVYRGGGGDMSVHGARRNDDTLAIFGEFLRRGPSAPRGRSAIARMEQIHSRFQITEEQKHYTLATLIFETERTGQRLGIPPAGHREARWRFWHSVADEMPLPGLPDTAEEFWQWTLAYERANWAYSEGGRAVVETFFDDWTTRWFPRTARPLGRQILLAFMDDGLRATHQLEAPSRTVLGLVRASAKAGMALTPLRPFRVDRSWVDYFGRRHGREPDFASVGHQPMRRHDPALRKPHLESRSSPRGLR